MQNTPLLYRLPCVGFIRPEWVWGLASFVFLSGVVYFGASTERSRQGLDLRTHIAQETLALVSRIESEINANVFLANGMAAHIMVKEGQMDEEIESLLKALHQYGRHIRNIGVAPDNRISHVYPREGNEAAIGLYYPDIPAQWPAVREAIEKKVTVLAGPVALRQGGTGLISRTPVFTEDGRYWGIISLVLDADSFFKAVGLPTEFAGTRHAFRHKNTQTPQPAFMGESALFDQDSVVMEVRVPGGIWELAAQPVLGWGDEKSTLFLLEFSGYGVSFILAVVFTGFLTGRRQLAEKEKRLRAFLETTHDAVIVFDAQGGISEFNPAAERLFGYPAHEMGKQRIAQLTRWPEGLMGCPWFANSTNTGMPLQGAGQWTLTGVRKDQDCFPLEMSVGQASVAGDALYVGVLRDMTERAAFEKRLVELATFDGLTGALNRRAFMEIAESAVLLANRHRRPLSLMMIDADHFKKINDQYGHHVGDAVLVRLSDLVRQCLRSTDSFGRLGGEEFVILLPETPLAHAEDVARRLLLAIRDCVLCTDEGTPVRFTVSIGLSGFLENGTGQIGALIKAADQALYRAKSAGRDQYQVA
jgi:diguanylate cyclase (GGDEF)-like protein/PAS domain S-box-containing protein